MLARCLSASLQGLEAHPVTVEVDLAPGLPGIQLVGLPDKAIQESRERVRSALRNSGFRGPLVRVVINLAPADLRKEGPAFDLPIALGLLVASGQLDRPRLHGIWCAGELGLDGSLRPCRGVIAIAELAARHGAQALVVPPGNADEAALIPDLVVRTAPDLKQLVQQLKGERPCLRVCRARPEPQHPEPPSIQAEGLAGRGLALAAAGGHHLLMVGPPGCGKTNLARQLPALLPPLSPDEALTITRIHSVAGQLEQPLHMQLQRPFRAPHHSSSAAALLGGGSNPRPGELSLAHGGVLFLDELAEFPRAVLDQLRQPLEEGTVRLSRARLKRHFQPRSLWWPPPTPVPVAGMATGSTAVAAAKANVSAIGSGCQARCWIVWICSCGWSGAPPRRCVAACGGTTQAMKPGCNRRRLRPPVNACMTAIPAGSATGSCRPRPLETAVALHQRRSSCGSD